MKSVHPRERVADQTGSYSLDDANEIDRVHANDRPLRRHDGPRWLRRLREATRMTDLSTVDALWAEFDLWE